MKPANLLFLMSDNHQRNFTGAYGHPAVRTPNIDSIARRGTLFENAYANSAVCCPARAALATGRYPHQTGYWDNVLVYDGKWPSWHRRLRDGGHNVTSIGKLHYIGDAETDDYGFTESRLAMHIVERKGALFGLLRADEGGEHPRPTSRENYKKIGRGESDYVLYDREIADNACSWLRENGAASEKPWALKVSFAAPHPPFTVPDRFMDMYPESEVRLPPGFRPEDQPTHPAFRHIMRIHSLDGLADESFLRKCIAGYCALITHMDEQVGKVLQTLADLGLDETTRVVYVSDHGEAAGHHGHFGKSVMYDHSVTVPLVACGPGIPAGKRIPDIVSHVDLFPTFVEALGVAPHPDDADLPGASLWKIIAGNVPPRPVIGEYHGHGSKAGMFMLRDGQMKLIYHVGMPAELYDLAQDPDELTDLAGHPDHAATLAALESRLRRIVDPEAADRRAMADQKAALDRNGGAGAILKRGSYGFNPVPGKEAAITSYDKQP
ncbi:MAG: sulfatase-like hydrolase/transferase [Rhodospirillales bacterium]